MICVIRHLARTVSDVCLKLGCFQSTSTYSALEVSHFMRCINSRLTCFLAHYVFARMQHFKKRSFPELLGVYKTVMGMGVACHSAVRPADRHTLITAETWLTLGAASLTDCLSLCEDETRSPRTSRATDLLPRRVPAADRAYAIGRRAAEHVPSPPTSPSRHVDDVVVV